MSALEKLERHHRSIQHRFLGSMAAYGAFAFAAVLFANAGRLQEDLSMLVLVVLLVASLLVLPRNTAPARWPKAEDADQSDQLDMLRDELRQLGLKATILRVVYLVITAMLLLLLPRMLA